MDTILEEALVDSSKYCDCNLSKSLGSITLGYKEYFLLLSLILKVISIYYFSWSTCNIVINNLSNNSEILINYFS